MTAPSLQRQRPGAAGACAAPEPAIANPAAAGASPRVGADPRVASRLAGLAAHLLVALVALVAVGGATRVMEAGLACPDWPLCYGSLLPGRQMNLQVFLEWFHRLDAFVVGVGLLVLAVASIGWRRQLPGWQPPLAVAAVLLVALQGGLGALTVLQLLPVTVVTAHLLTALLLVALLSGCHQGLTLAAASGAGSSGQAIAATAPTAADGAPIGAVLPPLLATLLPNRLTTLVAAVALALLAQCLLGGLMASQWAAGRCLSVGEGCGWLLAHRLAARPVAGAVLGLSLLLVWRRPPDRPLAALAALLVLVQIALGVLSLRLTLAVPGVTVAHQVTAALLVAVLSALRHV
jgi:cytochrome c oxidase assembly protein subunit 15